MKLADAKLSRYEELPLGEALSWLKKPMKRIVSGGAYLLGGPPGCGKSTLAIQIGADLGRQGIESLFLLTEQPAKDIAKRAVAITASMERPDAKTALKNMRADDTVGGLRGLLPILTSSILNPAGAYHGVRLVVLDSIQGEGTAPTASRDYECLFRFCQECRKAGITTLLLSHMTKKNYLAGPRTIEHAVDVVTIIRRGPGCSVLSMVKNRFAPVDHAAHVALKWDSTSALVPSPHSTVSIASTIGYNGAGLAEVQVSLSLPPYGSQGRLLTVGIPAYEVEQLLSAIGQLSHLSFNTKDYSVLVRLPASHGYGTSLGLATSICLVAAFRRMPTPSDAVYVGEVDLRGDCRPADPMLVKRFIDQTAEMNGTTRVYCPALTAREIREQCPRLDVVECNTLADAVHSTWPIGGNGRKPANGNGGTKKHKGRPSNA